MKDKDGRSTEDIADQQAGEEVLEIPNPPPGEPESMTGSGTTELTVEEQDILGRLGMQSDPPKADAAQPMEFTHGLPPASTQPNRGEPASTTTQDEPASTQPNRGETASDEDEGDNEASQRAKPCRRLVRVPCKDGWNVVYQHSSGPCVTYGPYDRVGKMMLHDDGGFEFFAYRGGRELYVVDGTEIPTGLPDAPEDAGKIDGTTDEAPVEEPPPPPPPPVVAPVQLVSLPRMARPLAKPAPVVELLKPALVVKPPAEPVPPAPPIAVTHAGEAAPASGRPSGVFALEELVRLPIPPVPEPANQATVVTGFTPQELEKGQSLFAPLPPPSGKKGKGIIRRVASKVWKAISRPAPASGKKLKVKRATPRKAQPFFKAFLASCFLLLAVVTAVSISMWFWEPASQNIRADQQPTAAPVRTGVAPAAPTATPLITCEREERDVSTASLSLVARASKGTKWQATGDAKCFQIDLDAWSTVSLGRGPGKVQAIVDCTKSKRSNATDRQRDGQPCWDVTDCVVASCRGWP